MEWDILENAYLVPQDVLKLEGVSFAYGAAGKSSR